MDSCCLTDACWMNMATGCKSVCLHAKRLARLFFGESDSKCDLLKWLYAPTAALNPLVLDHQLPQILQAHNQTICTRRSQNQVIRTSSFSPFSIPSLLSCLSFASCHSCPCPFPFPPLPGQWLWWSFSAACPGASRQSGRTWWSNGPSTCWRP